MVARSAGSAGNGLASAFCAGPELVEEWLGTRGFAGTGGVEALGPATPGGPKGKGDPLAIE